MKQVKTLMPSLFFALVLFTASFSSCKKSNDPPPAAKSVQGLWLGTVSNATSSQQYSLSINPGGKITFEAFTSGQEQFGAGTWTLVGSDFSAHVTTLYGFQSNIGVEQTLTAKFDSQSGTLTNGKYVNGSPSSDSGTFTLTKVE